MLNPRPAAHAAVFALATLLVTIASAAEPANRYWPPIVDPATGHYSPGRWVWGDLMTSDVAAAAEFYGKVFGWTYETYGSDEDLDTYTLVLSDGLPIGGMVFDRRALKDGTPAARWIGLVSVPDVTTASDAVTRGGGKVVLAPTDLGERGMTAVFQDPDGALFGVVHSKNGDPDDYAGDVNEWVWIDLWTSDVDRAVKFYRAVAGYDVSPLADGGARSGVRLVSGGYARAGIMKKRDARATPVWLPYVRVADAEAASDAARAAGGTVIREPVDIGAAIVAIIADPTGAPVGVAQLTGKEVRQ